MWAWRRTSLPLGSRPPRGHRRAIEANRNFPSAHFHLGAALAQLSRLDEARSAVKPASRSTPPSPSPAPAPPGRRSATTRHISPSSSPFSKVSARPVCPNNDRCPPTLRRSSPPTSSATRGSWARRRRGGHGLRACGQDGRGDVRLCARSPPPQSRTHGQMDEGTLAEIFRRCSTDCARRGCRSRGMRCHSHWGSSGPGSALDPLVRDP